MLTVDRDDAVQRLCDTVNAERLVGGGVVGFCLDDALLGDQPVVLTADRVFEQTLKHTVSLFGHLTGDGIRQHATAEGREIRGVGWVQNWNHERHLLPGIKIPPGIAPWWCVKQYSFSLTTGI